MKALRFDGTLKLVRDVPSPRRNGEALVQVISAGICNTDLEITKGYAGFCGTLGHEFVGRVVEPQNTSLTGHRVVGEINVGCGQCSLCLSGDSRHCSTRTVLGIKDRDGAFAEFLSLPPQNLIEVPDSMPDETAVFIEPVAAAYQILEQVSMTSSSTVAVIGDGKLAQLVVRVIAHTGCPITVIGKHEKKLALVSGIAVRCFQVTGEPEQDRNLLISPLTGQFDVVIEASGSASGMPYALDLVKPRGKVVLKSTHHKQTELELSAVVVQEISIIGSRCGRFRPAIDLLASGAIDLKPLISARFPLEYGLEAFERAAAPDSLKVLLQVA